YHTLALHISFARPDCLPVFLHANRAERFSAQYYYWSCCGGHCRLLQPGDHRSDNGRTRAGRWSDLATSDCCRTLLRADCRIDGTIQIATSSCGSDNAHYFAGHPDKTLATLTAHGSRHPTHSSGHRHQPCSRHSLPSLESDS